MGDTKVKNKTLIGEITMTILLCLLDIYCNMLNQNKTFVSNIITIKFK